MRIELHLKPSELLELRETMSYGGTFRCLYGSSNISIATGKTQLARVQRVRRRDGVKYNVTLKFA